MALLFREFERSLTLLVKNKLVSVNLAVTPEDHRKTGAGL
jgi:hypothetical protein